MTTIKELLGVAEAQRQKIIERRRKLEAEQKPLLDIQWQFASGMVAGATEVVRALVEAADAEPTG